MSKPTVIVVPGAWHIPKHYEAITSSLESKGYNVICKQNLTCGASDPSINNNDDAAAIRKSIDSVNGDVVIAMHSYGGVPGSTAAVGASNVIGLIFFAAFVLPSGTTVGDAPKHDSEDSSGDSSMHIDLEKGLITNTRPRTAFYNDVDEVTAQDAISQLQTQNVVCFGTPSAGTAWPDLPKIYAICTDDQVLPTRVQEKMVEQAGDWLEVKRFATGHSPWLSKGKEFNEWIDGAVIKLAKNKAEK